MVEACYSRKDRKRSVKSNTNDMETEYCPSYSKQGSGKFYQSPTGKKDMCLNPVKPWFCYSVLVSLRNRGGKAVKMCVREVRRREGEKERG